MYYNNFYSRGSVAIYLVVCRGSIYAILNTYDITGCVTVQYFIIPCMKASCDVMLYPHKKRENTCIRSLPHVRCRGHIFVYLEICHIL